MGRVELAGLDANGQPERDVFLKENVDELYPRIEARYAIAAQHIRMKPKRNSEDSHTAEMNVLEIGCSTGYGWWLLNKNTKAVFNYFGIDKDEKVIEAAKEQSWENLEPAQNAPKFVHVGDESELEVMLTSRKWDIIIACEVIEHIPDGLELLQKLKRYADIVVFSCPYKEPVGFWGSHHVLHQLEEKHFRGFRFQWIDPDGHITKKPPQNVPFSLIAGVYDQTKPVITCELSTKGRYHLTLPLALMSIVMQTSVKPDEIIIFDDGEHADLRDHEIYQRIFTMMDMYEITWTVIFTPNHGQVKNHEWARVHSRGDLIWRIDDDNIADPCVLKYLVDELLHHPEVGAVATRIIDPCNMPSTGSTVVYSGGIRENFLYLNPQWAMDDKRIDDMEHLYSSFLYRTEAASYSYRDDLSVVGHREETFFTHQMFLNKWKLSVLGCHKGVTWHFRCQGGIRSPGTIKEMWDNDESKYRQWLAERSLKLPLQVKIMIVDGGIGDHYMFKQVLPKIRAAYTDILFVIGVAHLGPFESEQDDNTHFVTIHAAKQLLGQKGCDPDIMNPYKYASENCTGTGAEGQKAIQEAYRSMYIEEKRGDYLFGEPGKPSEA